MTPSLTSLYSEGMTIPTIITLIRILAIPVIVMAFYLPFEWNNIIAAVIFLLAALSDWLDGYLARNLHQATRFGAFLDPVADKLIVATVLVLVVSECGMAYLAVPAAVIIGREIVVSALREWMAEIGKHTSVSVRYIGKIKTTFQFIALLLLLLSVRTPFGYAYVTGVLCLYVAAVLTIWSMVIYLKAAWSDLTFFSKQE